MIIGITTPPVPTQFGKGVDCTYWVVKTIAIEAIDDKAKVTLVGFFNEENFKAKSRPLTQVEFEGIEVDLKSLYNEKLEEILKGKLCPKLQ